MTSHNQELPPVRGIIAGGGAAGFFAAITAAEASPRIRVTLLEKGSRFLTKVGLAGGGRCNLTHAGSDPAELATHYPRGGQELLGPFHRFSTPETMAWFAARGVPLKVEDDGRVFPVTDASRSVVSCLEEAAQAAGVHLRNQAGVEGVERLAAGFALTLAGGERMTCDRLLLATGGCRCPAMGALAVSLGHTLELPVPSLFGLRSEASWLAGLAGLTVESAAVTVPGTGLRERAALLLTHEGFSGPAILRLSAWGARIMHEAGYQFPLHIDWLPHLSTEEIMAELHQRRSRAGARRIQGMPLPPLPVRLWQRLAQVAGVPAELTWSGLSRGHLQQLAQQLNRTIVPITGKSLNREEFVTCGGIRLSEINFKTMESRICPGLFLAGELLDIDGLTGGFNLQAAWTTGWIAGMNLARPSAGPA